MLLHLLAHSAWAHITMLAPTPVGAAQKVGPCGDGPHARGSSPAVFEPGATLTVEWRETVNHPSHYRISFDVDGDDSFADPETPTDFYTNDTVLLDEITDEPDGTFAVEVTLPAVECETCTLQLVQVMHDKPPYVPGTNDLYYQCADLALRASAGGPVTPTDPDTDTGAAAVAVGDPACGCDGTGAGGLALGLPVLLLVRRSSSSRSRGRAAPRRPPYHP